MLGNNCMDSISHTPDAPFRSGISGKYKLLIKSVTPGYSSFEYILEDSEGKQYSATSEANYPVNGILRCIITFSVEKAKLEVFEVRICKKQDLVTPIPGELKKPIRKSPTESEVILGHREQPLPPEKESSGPPKKDNEGMMKLGSPKKRLISGYYNLQVDNFSAIKEGYSYWLVDAEGNRYKTSLNRYLRKGTIVPCRLRIRILERTIAVDVMSVTVPGSRSEKTHKKRKKPHVKHHRSGGYSQRDWLPAPCAGDHFHLIYTPMGNKR